MACEELGEDYHVAVADVHPSLAHVKCVSSCKWLRRSTLDVWVQASARVLGSVCTPAQPPEILGVHQDCIQPERGDDSGVPRCGPHRGDDEAAQRENRAARAAEGNPHILSLSALGNGADCKDLAVLIIATAVAIQDRRSCCLTRQGPLRLLLQAERVAQAKQLMERLGALWAAVAPGEAAEGRAAVEAAMAGPASVHCATNEKVRQHCSPSHRQSDDAFSRGQG